MALEFIRRHHLLTALTLLAAAALAYLVGFATGAVFIVVLAAAIELIGWVLMFSGPPARHSER
jgi:hypothetical protein